MPVLAALDLGVENYRFVRRYLERRPQLSLRHVDPLIRELTEYRDLINLKTKENQNESDGAGRDCRGPTHLNRSVQPSAFQQRVYVRPVSKK